MPIRVSCPKCKGTMEARDELRGSQARCPYCREIVKVEPAPPVKAEMKPAPQMPPVRQPAQSDGPPAPTHKPVPAPPPPLVTPQLAVTATPPEERDGPKPHPTPAPTVVSVGKDTGTVFVPRTKRNRLVALVKSLAGHGSPTDASILLTAVAGALLTVLLYVGIEAIRPLRTSYFGELLTERTWVVHATIFLALWAGVILLVKLWKLAGQQAALSYTLLPVNEAVKVHPGNIDLVCEHINKLPVEPRKSFLINRVLLALENFKARKSVPEVGALLTAQGDTDAARVDSSYTMLKVLIWGIPILGFIGTVVGITLAVNNFTGTVSSAQELKTVQGALGKVTDGLAVAFDTTLIGLVLSIVVMFPSNALQKAEDDLLSSVDQYCNEKLLPRLAEEDPAAKREKPDRDVVLGAFQTALDDWQKRMESMETALFEKVADALADVRKELSKEPPVPEGTT
jgi:biopolymer transport protein ExbB/TolQ